MQTDTQKNSAAFVATMRANVEALLAEFDRAKRYSGGKTSVWPHLTAFNQAIVAGRGLGVVPQNIPTFSRVEKSGIRNALLATFPLRGREGALEVLAEVFMLRLMPTELLEQIFAVTAADQVVAE